MDESLSNVSLLNIIVGHDTVEVSSRLLRSSNMQLRSMQFSHSSDPVAAVSHVDVHGQGITHVCVQAAAKTAAYENS